jgi:hypothetical protein
MTDREKIEGYLNELELPWDEVGEAMWLIHDEGGAQQITVLHDPPLVVFRVRVMPLPSRNREALYRRLLELNATDLVHGAYGLEHDSVVLIDTLQAATLDFDEFRASVEALGVAVASHFKLLKDFAKEENR